MIHQQTSPGERRFVLLTIAFIVAVSFIREPLFFLQPRLWAEEGSVYLQAAVSQNDWSVVFRPHLGYYSLVPNLVTTLGLRVGGISGVAAWTTWTSFVVMILCLLAPLFLASRFWDTRWKRTAILVFTLTAGSAEIWLNTVNIQHYLCAFTCFLLLSDLSGWSVGVRRYVYGMTVLAALSGVTSVLLLPLVALRMRSLRPNDSPWKTMLGIFCVAFLVHAAGFILSAAETGSSRISLANLSHLPAGIALTLSGTAASGDRLSRILFVLAIVVMMVMVRRHLAVVRSPLLAAVYLGVVFTILSLEMKGGNRYAFAPSILVFVFLCNAVGLCEGRPARRIAIMAVVLPMLLAGVRYFETATYYSPSWKLMRAENMVRTGAETIELPVFPQWPQTHWVVSMTEAEYRRNP